MAFAYRSSRARADQHPADSEDLTGALAERSLLALAVGLLVLDVALQAVHVTNQSLLYAAGPEWRSRLAGSYMVFYSLGTAAGSIASTATYAWAGWTGVCALGAAISAAALAFWAATLPRTTARSPASAAACVAG